MQVGSGLKEKASVFLCKHHLFLTYENAFFTNGAPAALFLLLYFFSTHRAERKGAQCFEHL